MCQKLRYFWNKYETYYGPGSARNSCNSWPLYARWADQRACFGYLLQLLRALPSGSVLIN